MKRLKCILLILMILFVIVSCTTGNDPQTSSKPLNFDLEQAITSMPSSGGPVGWFSINKNGIVASSFNKKLYVSDASAKNWTLVDGTKDYGQFEYLPSGNLLALTSTSLIKYSSTMQPTNLNPSFAPSIESRIFVTASGIYIAPYRLGYNYGSELYFSNDEGNSWTLIPVPVQMTFYFGSYVSQNGHIMFSDYNYIYRSDDQGKTWKSTASNLIPQYFFETSTGRVFAYANSSSRSAFISDNNGLTFTELIPNPAIQFNHIYESGGYLYASFVDENSTSVSGIYKSSDKGANWSLIFPARSTKFAINNERWVFAEMTPDPATSRGLGLSDNSGTNWRMSGPDIAKQLIDSYGFMPDGKLVISNNGALYKQLTDGWELLASPANSSVSTAATNFKDKVFISSAGKIMYCFSAKYPGILVINNGLYQTIPDFLSKSKGASNIDRVISGTFLLNGDFLYCVAYANNYQNNGTILYISGQFYKILNNQTTLQKMTTAYNAETIVTTPSGNLIALTYDYFNTTAKSYDAFKSTDGGTTWVTYPTNMIPYAYNAQGNFMGIDIGDHLLAIWYCNIKTSLSYRTFLNDGAMQLAGKMDDSMFDAQGRLYYLKPVVHLANE